MPSLIYFANLLPEGTLRQQIVQDLKVYSHELNEPKYRLQRYFLTADLIFLSKR